MTTDSLTAGHIAKKMSNTIAPQTHRLMRGQNIKELYKGPHKCANGVLKS